MDNFDLLQDVDFDNLEDSLRLTDPVSGRVLMSVCLNVTLFFREGMTQQKRQAMLDMLDDYQTMMDGKINFTTNPQTGAWKNLKKRPYMTPHDWLLDTPDEKWSFTYHGGEHHRDASDVRFMTLGKGSRDDKLGRLSWVTVNFPMTFFADWHESVQTVVLRWIKALQPLHGYAAFATTHNHFDDRKHEEMEYYLASHYPGLDVSNPISFGIKLEESIKGINWLTVVSQPYVDKVGGIEAVKAIDGLTVWKEGEVYLIQAAPAPMTKRIPDSYYQLGALFSPIRLKNMYTIHHSEEVGKAFHSDESFQQWLARFDAQPKEK